MDKETYKNFTIQGFFSEYLPPCFKLDKKALKFIPPNPCDTIEPYCFTMSKYDKNDSRRNIFIPEIGAYLVAQNYMQEKNIIEELIKFTKTENFSFSPVINQDDIIYKFEQSYGEYDEDIDQVLNTPSNYIDNISNKIIRATGAKKILKLDISNFYFSIYTHNIPAILLGLNKAREEYEKTVNKENNISDIYTKYAELDRVIRQQNLNKTNGLLTGTFSSRLISEALLTRIDKDLKNQNLNFVRYVDDYEFFIYDDDVETIKNKVNNIFRQYGLTINSEKISIEDFPYFVYNNLNKLFKNLYKQNFDNESLTDLFNTFYKLETKGVKGAIRFLVKSLDNSNIKTSISTLYKSHLLTILQNNKRSLIKVCQLLLDMNSKHLKISGDDITLIKKILFNNLEQNNDLEVIWLLFLLINISGINTTDEIVEKISSSNNELAQLLLLKHNLLSEKQKEIIKSNSHSWILNYELFSENLLTKEEFKNKLNLDKSLDMYNRFKTNNVHFCKGVI